MHRIIREDLSPYNIPCVAIFSSSLLFSPLLPPSPEPEATQEGGDLLLEVLPYSVHSDKGGSLFSQTKGKEVKRGNGGKNIEGTFFPAESKEL